MENGFYSSMALANTRLKEKRSGNVSISYTQTLQSLLNLFNEEQIKKFSEWIPTNGNTIDINGLDKLKESVFLRCGYETNKFKNNRYNRRFICI